MGYKYKNKIDKKKLPLIFSITAATFSLHAQTWFSNQKKNSSVAVLYKKKMYLCVLEKNRTIMRSIMRQTTSDFGRVRVEIQRTCPAFGVANHTKWKKIEDLDKIN